MKLTRVSPRILEFDVELQTLAPLISQGLIHLAKPRKFYPQICQTFLILQSSKLSSGHSKGPGMQRLQHSLGKTSTGMEQSLSILVMCRRGYSSRLCRRLFWPRQSLRRQM